MKRFLTVLPAFFIILLTSWAVADTMNGAESALSTVVVTASRISTLAENTPGDVTIITREQIREMNPARVIDIMRQVPGVYIDQKGGRGGISSVNLRGGDPNYTLVLIDGVKVNDPTNARGGSFNFSTLNVENIERIEIVKGPMSSVHGSDALAGVINIITKNPTNKTEFTAEAETDVHRNLSGNFQASGPIRGKANYSLAATYADKEDIMEGDAFEGAEITGKVNLFPSDTIALNTNVRFSESSSESFPDDSGGPDYAVLRTVDQTDTRETTLGLALTGAPNRLLLMNLSASAMLLAQDLASPGVAPGLRNPGGLPASRFENRYSRYRVSGDFLVSPVERFKTKAGMDAEFDDGESDGEPLEMFGMSFPTSFEMSRKIYSPFLELQYGFDMGLILSATLRSDIPEDFDTEYTPRLGALYAYAPTNTSFKANWGKGFKLPSFFALSHPIVGNPDLLPETSEGYDFGIIQEFHSKKIRMEITPFQNTYTNVIDFDGNTNRMINRPEVETRGIQAGIDVDVFRKVTVGGHAVYTDIDITGSNETMRNRPEWTGGLDLTWSPGKDFHFSTAVTYVDERLDSSIPTGDRILSGYIRTDASLLWKIRKNLDLNLAVDNLFNENYEEAVGYPVTHAEPRLSVRWAL